MVLEVQPERAAELQEYASSVEDLFFLLRPQFHSFVIELDKSERKRVGNAGRNSRQTSAEGPAQRRSELYEIKGEKLHVQVRGNDSSAGGQALGAYGYRLIYLYLVMVWKTVIYNLFKLMSFFAFS